MLNTSMLLADEMERRQSTVFLRTFGLGVQCVAAALDEAPGS